MPVSCRDDEILVKGKETEEACKDMNSGKAPGLNGGMSEEGRRDYIKCSQLRCSSYISYKICLRKSTRSSRRIPRYKQT